MATHQYDESQIAQWIHNLPKAELHLHLEGAIPLGALWELIQKYDGDPSTPTREALRDRLTYNTFPDFIETWIWKNGFLRTYDDFQFIAKAIAEDLLRQNILYAEMFFSPSRFSEHGLTTKGLAQAIRSGFDEVAGVELWLIADLVRDHGPIRAEQTLEEAADAREFGIVGIGMGGSEHLHPPKPFAKVYAEARRLGFKTSVHAGEAAGSESVWGALQDLEVDRIGHATRAREDIALLEHLEKEATPLELCPLSNVATGVIPSYKDHPVHQYWQHGLNITINTDDPGMFHNHLTDEYMGLMDHFHFSPDDIRQLILNALECSWRPTNGPQSSLTKQFQSHPNWKLPQ